MRRWLFLVALLFAARANAQDMIWYVPPSSGSSYTNLFQGTNLLSVKSGTANQEFRVYAYDDGAGSSCYLSTKAISNLVVQMLPGGTICTNIDFGYSAATLMRMQSTGPIWYVGSVNQMGLTSTNLKLGNNQTFCFTSSDGSGTCDVSLSRAAAHIAKTAAGDWVQQTSGEARVTTQFDKTTDTALADVTGLSIATVASTAFRFKATLYLAAGTTGGVKVGINHSTAVTGIHYTINCTNESPALVISKTNSAVGGSDAVAGATAYSCIVEGLVRVNTAGNLTVQFAQSVSDGTASSVLVDSNLSARVVP